MPQTSFLPEEYLEKKLERRTNFICLTLFVVVMGGVIAAFFVTDRQRRELRAQQASINEEFHEAAQRLQQLEKLEQQKQEMMRKARLTADLVERLPRSLILAELVNRMPASLSLLEVDMQSKTIRTAAPPRSKLEAVKKSRQAQKQTPDRTQKTRIDMTLVGLAPTDVQVARFMTALSQCAMFEDLNLRYSQETSVEDQTMRRFRLDMRVNEQLDPRRFEPTLVDRSKLKQNPMDSKVQIGAEGLMLPTHDRQEAVSAAPTD